MGAIGRRLADREFDERIVFGRVLATYERLLGARPNLDPTQGMDSLPASAAQECYEHF
jgi:hypothetical protein